MKTMIRVIAIGLGVISVVACSDPPPPTEARVSFTACTGRGGTCSGGSAASYDRAMTVDSDTSGSSDVYCTIYEGSVEGNYRVRFRARSDDGDTAIEAYDLEFTNDLAAPAVVRNCATFEVREGGNDYESLGACTDLEPREEDRENGIPAGGGCVIEAHLSFEDALVGRFQCKELRFMGQDLYFSTIHEGVLGWGAFRFDNCDQRF